LSPDAKEPAVKKQSLMQQFEDYQAPKAAVFWLCAASAIATMVVGFSWGGWTLGGTAQEMATRAASSARAEVAAAVCAQGFMRGPDATAQLATLRSTDSWKRSAIIEAGGWVTMPGADKPVSGAADLCVQHLTS
jgi:dienelactone hydrolase